MCALSVESRLSVVGKCHNFDTSYRPTCGKRKVWQYLDFDLLTKNYKWSRNRPQAAYSTIKKINNYIPTINTATTLLSRALTRCCTNGRVMQRPREHDHTDLDHYLRAAGRLTPPNRLVTTPSVKKTDTIPWKLLHKEIKPMQRNTHCWSFKDNRQTCV